MNLVIPLAGHGSRFIESGYTVPKPFITSLGKTLLEWSMASLPLDIIHKIIYVVRKEHVDRYPEFKKIFKKVSYDKVYKIIILPEPTEGQMITVMKAQEFINNDSDLIIYNTDTYFKSYTLKDTLLSAKKSDIAGVLGAFKGKEEKWSFAKIGSNGYVEKTTEKVPISDIALTGLYHFTKGSDFIRIAHKAITEDLRFKNEFYIAPMYNYLIQEGKKIIVDMVDEFWCMGTPKDLQHFESNYKNVS